MLKILLIVMGPEVHLIVEDSSIILGEQCPLSKLHHRVSVIYIQTDVMENSMNTLLSRDLVMMGTITLRM